MDKLCAFLSTEDKPISREGFGPLTATLVPPFMVIIVQVLEMLMALDKGVKCFSLSFGQMGNLQQDFITAAAMRKVASYFVDRLKQKFQPRINLVYHQWMGAFPVNTEHAQALISLGTISAKLCRANKIVIKTVAEAHSIPDEKTNMQAVQLVDFLIKHSGVLPDFNSSEVKEEIDILVEQVIFVLNKILSLDEILEVSVIKAIELGFIDIPFAPHQKNAGLLWCARDNHKNIRVVDFGNIPTTKEFKMFETQELGLIKNQTV